MSVLNITHIHKKSKELRTTDMDFSLLTHTCLFRFEVGTCMYWYLDHENITLIQIYDIISDYKNGECILVEVSFYIGHIK